MINFENIAEGIRNIDLIRIYAQSKENRILATSTFPYSFYHLTRYYLHIGLTRRYKTFCSKYHRNGIIGDLCVICHKTKIRLINMARRSGGGEGLGFAIIIIIFLILLYLALKAIHAIP